MRCILFSYILGVLCLLAISLMLVIYVPEQMYVNKLLPGICRVVYDYSVTHYGEYSVFTFTNVVPECFSMNYITTVKNKSDADWIISTNPPRTIPCYKNPDNVCEPVFLVQDTEVVFVILIVAVSFVICTLLVFCLHGIDKTCKQNRFTQIN